jgi:hypothetical protein
MWKEKDGSSGQIVCDMCGNDGNIILRLGNVIEAELCSVCSAKFRAVIDSMLKTKPGPYRDSPCFEVSDAALLRQRGRETPLELAGPDDFGGSDEDSHLCSKAIDVKR